MNIFVLDKAIEKCAQYHADKHVIKMILESAQILCTVLNTNGQAAPYRSTHSKHPCTLWAGESLSNWLWLQQLGLALNKEYKFRYNKEVNHRSADVIANLEQPKIKDIGLTPFAQAMPDKYKVEGDPVSAYRAYYKGDKAAIATWKNRPVPDWFNNKVQKNIPQQDKKSSRPQTRKIKSEISTVNHKKIIRQNVQVKVAPSKGSNQLHRIASYEEHRHWLEKLFKRAQHEILLTTKALNYQSMQEMGILDLIAKLRSRPNGKGTAVKIYIFHKDPIREEHLYEFLMEHDILLSSMPIATEFLGADKHTACIGAFNWLCTRKDQAKEETTFVYTGSMATRYYGLCWQNIHRYRYKQHRSHGASRRASIRELKPLHIDKNCRLLPTRRLLRSYFQNLFARAKKRIVICSPFISSYYLYLKDLGVKTIKEAVEVRGVHIIFVFQAHCRRQVSKIQKLLRKLPNSHVHYVPIERFHLKTLILDDKEISEGAFQWLSTTQQESDEARIMDNTLIISGKVGNELIKDFDNSVIGETVESTILK